MTDDYETLYRAWRKRAEEAELALLAVGVAPLQTEGPPKSGEYYERGSMRLVVSSGASHDLYSVHRGATWLGPFTSKAFHERFVAAPSSVTPEGRSDG